MSLYRIFCRYSATVQSQLMLSYPRHVEKSYTAIAPSEPLHPHAALMCTGQCFHVAAVGAAES